MRFWREDAEVQKQTATADSPFGFAQGKLCGDDSQKDRGNGGFLLSAARKCVGEA
jgi:hypothetical protein